MNGFEFFLLLLVAAIAYWLGTHHPQVTGPHSSTNANNDPAFVTDPATGIAFATSQKFEVAKHFGLTAPLKLIGVGTRKKAIVNIYSLGFFVAPNLSKEVTRGSKNMNPCEVVQHSNAPKAVQLIFHIAIGPERIAEAISQLEHVDEQIKKDFHDMLLVGMGGGKMKKGESMTFEWKGKDTILATARGTLIGQVKDEALAKGVLELYLDARKSVSPSLLNSLGCTTKR